MCNALGIINFEDNTVNIAGMMDYRSVPAISIYGRYRIIDFVLSNMTNSGLSHIQVYIKNKPRSIIEHLGTGSHYNINSKRGRLQILHGEQEIYTEIYNHDIASFIQNMQFIEEANEPYVVIAPSYMIHAIDYNEVLKQHLETKADITMVYKTVDTAKEQFIGCDVISLDKDKKIMSMEKNRGKYKSRHVSLESYVMSKNLFIELVYKASTTSSLYWFKDILADSVDDFKMVGFAQKGYVACVNSINEYYRSNMDVIDFNIAKNLFDEEWPIHTKTNDSSPTQYCATASVSHAVLANGCFIEGILENCVVGRNVVVKKGAVIKNSVILPGAYIGEDAYLDHVIVDKNAVVNHIKRLAGTEDKPIYVKRRDRI